MKSTQDITDEYWEELSHNEKIMRRYELLQKYGESVALWEKYKGDSEPDRASDSHGWEVWNSIKSKELDNE